MSVSFAIEGIDGEIPTANGDPPMFWTGWSEFDPGTDVYGVDTAGGK